MGDQIKLSGLLIATERDGNDFVTELALFTDNEDFYIIANKDKYLDLLSYVRRRIEFVGEVFIDDNGKKCISIADYSILTEEKWQ